MTKIFAKCTNPKVDYLTDGKLYEVTFFDEIVFSIKNYSGHISTFGWHDAKYATWTRVEQQDPPPQWAIDKADTLMKEAGFTYRKALAATLAKYETEPVDPVLLKARELLAELHLKSNGFERVAVANSYTEGDYDESIETQAVIAALHLPAMESSQ